MQVAKSLIGNAAVQVFSVAQYIYRKCFEKLEKRHKHAVIQILIDHVTCSSTSSRDNSLDVLIELCSTCGEALVSFSLELKCLLNYIEYYNLSQIRKVYSIICSIAYYSSAASKSSSALEKLPPLPTMSQMNATSSSSLLVNQKRVPPSLQHQADTSLSSVQDNLHILINKQLSSNVLKYKQIGTNLSFF
jgi:hypothetical protein